MPSAGHRAYCHLTFQTYPFTRTPVHRRVLPSMPIRESLMSMLIKFRILFYEIHLFSASVLLLKISYKLLYCPCTETNSSLPVLSSPSVIPWSGLFKTVHEAASEADPIYLRLTLDRLLIRSLNLLSCLSFVPQRQTQPRAVIPMVQTHAFMSKTVIFAASALVLSAIIQLATTYVQLKYQQPLECACSHSLPSSSNFENEYCKYIASFGGTSMMEDASLVYSVDRR